MGRWPASCGAPEHEYTRACWRRRRASTTPGAGISRASHRRRPQHRARSTVRQSATCDHRLRAGWLRRRATLHGGRWRVARSRGGRGTGHRRRIRLRQVDADAARCCGWARSPRGEIVWLGRPIQDLRGEELRSHARRDADRVPGSVREPRSDHERGGHRRRAAARAAARPGRRGARRDAWRPCWRASGSDAEYAQRRSRELSGGQCQRVAIARAMVLEPRAAGVRRGGQRARRVDPGAAARAASRRSSASVAPASCS